MFFWMVMFIIFVVLPIIYLLVRRQRYNSLSQEDKEILKLAKEKTRDIKNNANFIIKVALLSYVIVLLIIMIFNIFMDLIDVKSSISPKFNNELLAVVLDENNSTQRNLPVMQVDSTVVDVWKFIFNVMQFGIAIYVTTKIIANYKFMKEIAGSENLNEKEKELLKTYYGGRTIPAIYFGVILEIMIAVLKFILSIEMNGVL